MFTRRLPRVPRLVSLAIAAMSGVIALDYLRVYVTERSGPRLVALIVWAVFAVAWSLVFALSLKPRRTRDDQDEERR